jgi:hypothetical protein
MFRLRWLTAVVCLVLTGCLVGPKYKRPQLQCLTLTGDSLRMQVRKL